MKLIRFQATKVHDYMNFDIDFNSDVSFLIGANGSGKTTAIKMIKAILSPSIVDLLSISFEYCQLDIERAGKKIAIVFERKSKKSNEFMASYDNFGCMIELPEHILRSIDYVEFDKKESFTTEIESLSDNEVFNKIRKLPTPIFLGVDRKNSDGNISLRGLREAYITTSNRRHIQKGVLGNALLETQLMIQDSYKGIRNLEEKQSGVLRDSILKSSFKFSSFNPEDIRNPNRNVMQVNQLINKKQEIQRALSKIDGVDESLYSEVESFFGSLGNILSEMDNSGDEAGFNLNWLMNQAQIKRIYDLVDVIETYDNKIQDIYKPVIEFLDIVNKFFIDSNKKIAVDPVGRILVYINERKRNHSVGCLSSGERQLLIIIAHVIFNRYRTGIIPKQNIIIIDEPEISLHMRWQEMFSEIILEVSPETQFILATHSPDIVGDLTSKCKKVMRASDTHVR